MKSQESCRGEGQGQWRGKLSCLLWFAPSVLRVALGKFGRKWVEVRQVPQQVSTMQLGEKQGRKTNKEERESYCSMEHKIPVFLYIFTWPLDGTADRVLISGLSLSLSLHGKCLSFSVLPLSLHFLLLVLSYVTFSSTQLLNRTEAFRCEGQSEVWIGTLWGLSAVIHAHFSGGTNTHILRLDLCNLAVV